MCSNAPCHSSKSWNLRWFTNILQDFGASNMFTSNTRTYVHEHQFLQNCCMRTFRTCEHASNMPSNMRTYVHTNTFYEHAELLYFMTQKLIRWRSFESRLGSTLQHTGAHPNTLVGTKEKEKNFEPAKPACEHGSNMVQTSFQHAVKHDGNTITQTCRSRTSDSSARIHFQMNDRLMIRKAWLKESLNGLSLEN